MLRIIALTLTLSALAACATPMVRAPQTGESVVYILESIDERALPYLEGTGSSIARREISEGLLQLGSDGTFFMSLSHYLSTGAGTHRGERNHQGLWTRVGDVVDFEFDDGSVGRGEIRDGSILVDFAGTKYRWSL